MLTIKDKAVERISNDLRKEP